MQGLRNTVRERYFTFLAIALAWSWGFLFLAIMAQANGWEGLVAPCRLLAGVGPLLAAMVMLLLGPKEDRSDYLGRLTDVSKVRPKWLAFILLIVPAITVSSIIIDMVAGCSGGRLEEGFSDALASPMSFAGFLAFSLFFGPVPEEMGWGGYGVWKAQLAHTPVATGTIIGMAWMVWHVPLFFIVGTYQEGLGFGTIESLEYLLMIFFQALIMVWIFNNTSGSIPAAVLFHFMVNLVGEMVSLSGPSDMVMATLWGILALTVLLRYRLEKVHPC